MSERFLFPFVSEKGWMGHCGAAWTLFLLLLATAGCQTFTANSRNAEGVRLLAASRDEEALDRFEEARAADPSNPDAYYNCGVVYHERAIETEREADFQMARYYYTQCLERAQDHVECNRSMATLLCDIGQSDDAFRLVEAWVARQPNSPEPRIELARLYDEHNQLARARDCLNDAIAIDNRNVRAYNALGSVRERMGDNEQAISAYERALALNPYQPEVNHRISELRYTVPQSPANPVGPGRENALDSTGDEMIATPGMNTPQ